MIVEVNPATVRSGYTLAVRTKMVYNTDTDEETEVVTSKRVVKRVSLCGKLECIHLDHECYDTRFSTVKVVR